MHALKFLFFIRASEHACVHARVHVRVRVCTRVWSAQGTLRFMSGCETLSSTLCVCCGALLNALCSICNSLVHLRIADDHEDEEDLRWWAAGIVESRGRQELL